jgi:hypothetical protein
MCPNRGICVIVEVVEKLLPKQKNAVFRRFWGFWRAWGERFLEETSQKIIFLKHFGDK